MHSLTQSNYTHTFFIYSMGWGSMHNCYNRAINIDVYVYCMELLHVEQAVELSLCVGFG